ncbi:unnamed protein product, partial [Callosobruchus maculatus]
STTSSPTLHPTSQLRDSPNPNYVKSQLLSTCETNSSSIWSPASIDSFALDQHRWCSSGQTTVLSTTNSAANYTNYPYYTNMDYLSSTSMNHSQFGTLYEDTN